MSEPKFTLREFSGSLADLGTIVPFILIAVTSSGMRLGPILLAFGLFYVYSGFVYRLPMPVEPLKVVGAIAVAGGLSHGEVVGAGLFVGLFFLLMGVTGAIGYLEKIFPLSLIRGVQLGLALLLLYKGGTYAVQDLYVGVFAVLLVAVSILWNRWQGKIYLPGALIVLVLGVALGFYLKGVPPMQLSLPLDPYIPAIGELISGTYKAGIAQVPLTLTNAVLATSLLASDLFKEKVSSKRLSVNIGLINLLATPLGGFPMCHGAGGLAAHYRFGARTGGADIMIGLLFVALSFIGTSSMLSLVPAGILGTLLMFAGIELLVNSINTDMAIVTAATGIVTLLVDPTIGLLAGVAAYAALKIMIKDKSAQG
ncbi:MAG TPA: putative sulfate/molybdate transporter [Methanocella sp.]|nr:putative sulfate/molybdate transporter [Methanocella sp.]